MNAPAELPPVPLPDGIRSRMVPGINGLTVHVLEAGFETTGRPGVLLLHGFPELAFSWRKIMVPLARAGFHVIAPDQRGYGRTTGWSADYDDDLRPYSPLNLVRDALGLVSAFGWRSVAAVVGHDFGSPIAAWCALTRPDVFRAVTMMSGPFGGPPPIPFDTLDRPQQAARPDTIQADLAALPRPRKHYHWYYATREADADMTKAPQGLHAFLRAYYHMKSADWPGNAPFPLASWTAGELAKLPEYYVMDLHRTMPESVAPHMPSPEQIAACRWLTEDELAFYSAEYTRTGFQGGLQWYRGGTSRRFAPELELYAGRTIDVPSCFISGASDWGVHQRPGALKAMQERVCTRMLGCHLIEGAGHWVQQEQPERVSALLIEFLGSISQTA